MKFTLSWLKDYLDTTATLAEISARLTAIGLEVEAIEDRAAALEGFVVGHVVSAEKHPDADKLRCLVVDTGTEKLKVVCGAPNARAGMKGVFAPAGCVIPASGLKLKKTSIRGQDSNGMMCSARELLLSEDHAGIIELPESAAPGAPAAAALGVDDPVIEINLTPNRGDCASVYGLARDLAAAGLGALKPPPTASVAAAFKNPIGVTLHDAAGCPLFIGRYVRNVTVGPSPEWLQRRLASVGLNPISAPVDITNYFTHAFGRPLHVFDADRLKGGLHVRRANPGETLEALNGKSYALDESMVAVCDESGVLGLGGIIGGASSGVTENTKNIYIECAVFDPAAIAQTGQKLQIQSDARYRFERGVDADFAAPAMEMATRMLIDLCGGAASETAIAGAPPVAARRIRYRFDRLKTLGGRDLPPARQKDILAALGFIVAEDGTVMPPSWRADVEGEADVVEEILRVDGYDNIPAVAVTRPPGALPPAPHPTQRRARAARKALIRRGMLESVTWSFLDGGVADLFGANAHQNKAALTLVNPISEDLAVMRPSLLPHLILAAGKNADRGYPDMAAFEVANAYISATPDGQVSTAAGIRRGLAAPRHWSAPARVSDALDAKADALAVLDACGVNVNRLQLTRNAPDWYHPGRSGALSLGAKALAYFGEIHPGVVAALKQDAAVVGFEVFLNALPPPPRKTSARPQPLHLSPLQPVARDFAFLVDQNVEAAALLRAARAADPVLISDAAIFDVYAGKGVAEGKKSVGLSVILQPVEKTLTDEEIAALCARLAAAVEKATGGTLRG